MPPVSGSIIVLGVSPAFGFDVGIEPKTSPLTDTSDSGDASTFRPLPRTAAFTWFGVRFGRA
jgi:hypothetical protein